MLWLAARQRREGRADGSRTERLAAHEVTLLLAVPSITQPLRDELDDLELELPASVTGYHQVEGAMLPLVVIDLGVVAEREDDDVLRFFAGLRQRTLEGGHWVMHHVGSKGDDVNTIATPDLFGYDEMLRRLVASLSPEERLDGLSPEERLAGLAREQLLLALPDELVQGLSDEFVAGLSDELQARIRARRGR